jgi:O-antigen ligase
MATYLRLVWPYGLMMLVIAGASLFFGADTRMTALLFSGLLLLLGGIVTLQRRRVKLPPLMIAALVALLAFCLADFFTGRLVTSGTEFAILAAAGAVFLVGYRAGSRNDYISPVWTMMLVIFMAIAIWAFADFIANPDSIHGRPRPYHEDRLSAAFLSANTAATFFGMVVLASAASIFRGLTKIGSFHFFTLLEGLFKHALVGVVTFLFASICLLLTASRAGLAFTALALVVLTVWEIIAFRRKEVEASSVSLVQTVLVVLSVLVLMCVGFWGMSGDVAGARYAELDDDANMRVVMFTAYWEAFLQKPFFGHGLGSFDAVNNAIMTSDNAHILATQGAAHNLFLQWLMQTGIVGTAIMFGLVGVIFFTIWQGLAHRRRYRGYLRAVLVISFFIMMHGMVDYALEIPGFMWWWALMLGMATSIAISDPAAYHYKRQEIQA